MKTLEKNVQYVTTVAVNNTPVKTLTNEGKLGISAFKEIATDARGRDPKASITTVRLVDGVEDGGGTIMRYSQKGDAVVLPQGRYHRVDTLNPTPERIVK